MGCLNLEFQLSMMIDPVPFGAAADEPILHSQAGIVTSITCWSMEAEGCPIQASLHGLFVTPMEHVHFSTLPTSAANKRH